MEAEILLQYDNETVAKAVADAISPDNIRVPSNLRIKTKRRGKTVSTEISSLGEFMTLIATIDDLLASASMAEKAVAVTKSLG